MNEKIKMNSTQISVVLPSYNERENIVEAIERISKTLGDDLLEIIVVDDNSPDGTWKLVEELNHPKVKLIHRITEKGLASALAAGTGEAKGDIVVWMDSDLGLPPEVIPRLVEKLESHDVAVGSRFVAGGKDVRKMWLTICSRIINFVAQIFLGFHIKDYTSGFIAVRREVFKKVKINPRGFGEYFIEFVYKCSNNNFNVIEVGYVYGNRSGGKSKSSTNLLVFLKLGLQYLLKIITLRLMKSSLAGSIMISKIPSNIYNLYTHLSIKDKLYLKLRWRLCPFKEISEHLPKNGLVLDVGCGAGILSNLLAVDSEKRNVLGIDLSERRIKTAKSSIGSRKNIEFKQMHVKDFEPQSCKGAVMSDFLHHLTFEAQKNLIKDIHAKLDENGILVIQDVDKKPKLKFLVVYFLDHFLNPGDKIYYRDKNNYKRLLEDIGFKTEAVDAHKGLPLSDVIYICKKN